MTVAKITEYFTQGQDLSQSKNVLIRSHLEYANACYGQTYPQRKIGS